MEVILTRAEDATLVTTFYWVLFQVLVRRLAQVIQRVLIVAWVVVRDGSADQHWTHRQAVDREIEVLLLGRLGHWVEVLAAFLLDLVSNLGYLHVGQVLRECHVLTCAGCLACFVVPEPVFNDLLDFVFVIRLLAVEQVFKWSLLLTFFHEPVREGVHLDFLKFVWYFNHFHDFGTTDSLFAEFQFVKSVFE